MGAIEKQKRIDVKFSDHEFQRLGDGDFGYIREIGSKEAIALLGSQALVPPGSRLFCLYNADGTPVSISGSREAAFATAIDQELAPLTVH